MSRASVKRRWTAAELTQIVRMRQDGRSLDYMARALGRSTQSVQSMTSDLVQAGRLTDGRERNRPGAAAYQRRTEAFCVGLGFPVDRLSDYRIFRAKRCPRDEAAGLVRREIRT